MAPSLNLSDDERFALMKFRRNVAELKKPYEDDAYLLRWLRARNFDVEAAENMLRESMNWREKWEVDKLKDWVAPEVLNKYYVSGISGFDKEGAPVIVVPFAGIDMWGLMHCITKGEFIKKTIKTLELYLDIVSEQAKKHGVAASQVVGIIDMDNFNIRQYAWKPAGETVVALLQMYEANYPEILKCCYIINTPKVFSIAFSVVKTFLNEKTVRKMQILKNDPNKWKPALLSTIEGDQLPAYYGGTQTDPDGNPKCATKVLQGGKVPKTYYAKKTDKNASPGSENFTTVVVKKGDKVVLPLIAPVEKSIIKWEFRTDGHDIKFGVTCVDEEGNETEPVPLQKVNSHQSAQSGAITCPVPATYNLIFDNTYSYLRSKKLHFQLDVVLPAGIQEEDQYR